MAAASCQTIKTANTRTMLRTTRFVARSPRSETPITTSYSVPTPFHGPDYGTACFLRRRPRLQQAAVVGSGIMVTSLFPITRHRRLRFSPNTDTGHAAPTRRGRGSAAANSSLHRRAACPTAARHQPGHGLPHPGDHGIGRYSLPACWIQRPSAYVVGEPGHRHHLICSNCGYVVAFTTCPVESAVSELGRSHDFAIEGTVWRSLVFVSTAADRPSAQRVPDSVHHRNGRRQPCS